jgi:hypothetical protein
MSKLCLAHQRRKEEIEIICFVPPPLRLCASAVKIPVSQLVA